jgi:inward rectifier potassium channel
VSIPEMPAAAEEYPTSTYIPVRERDLGFGSVVAGDARKRLLNRDGSFNVHREGLRYWRSLSLYTWLLQITWTRFFLLVVATYLSVNAIFAGLYLLAGSDALAGDRVHDAWLTAFFFSVETLGTIGYGSISPHNLAANVLMTVEALVGLMLIALTTGILFARFSRPVARIVFSNRALIAPFHGQTAFMFRIANEASSQMVEVEARIVLAIFDRADGHGRRRFHVLSLERNRVVFLPLSWTIVHPIEEGSPLYGLTQRDLAERSAEFLVLLTGMDETFSQTVHARSSYRYDEIVWGAKFSDIFEHDRASSELAVDVSRLHAYEPAPLPGSA